MSPFLAICAREVSGKLERYVAESTQKLAPQSLRNSRLVWWELDPALLSIRFSILNERSWLLKDSLMLSFPFWFDIYRLTRNGYGRQYLLPR